MSEINSIADLISILKSDFSADDTVRWFRGHANFSWELISSYERLKNPPKETSLVKDFRQNANSLLTHSTPQSGFDWLFLMQHYGVPTRLLDWSESALVALFFALDIEDKTNLKKDGALWILLPNKLNENTNKSKDNYIPAFEEEEYMDSYSTEKFDQGRNNGLCPIAAIATRNNPRIQAQLGVFTISNAPEKSIDQIGDKSHIKKYRIPFSSKVAISKELSLLGIDKFQVFPELSCIGDIIKRKYS